MKYKVYKYKDHPESYAFDEANGILMGTIELPPLDDKGQATGSAVIELQAKYPGWCWIEEAPND